MTFRQVLDIVWRRKWLVLVVTALVILAAVLYARLAPVTYESTVTLRYSPAGTSTLSGSAPYGTINLDLDPDFAQSPEIATAAATTLGEDPLAIQAAVAVSTNESTRTTRVTLTVTGSSPAQARDRATAVAEAFVGHLNDQIAEGLKGMKADLARQQKAQNDALRTLAKRPNDQLAQTNFSTATSQINQIQTQIVTIQGNGAPVSILQPATIGLRQGVSFLTIVLIGITSGLLAGAGIALIWDQFDDHIRSTEDVEEVIGDHVLGDVAVVPRRQLKLAPLPAATRLPTPLNESIRSLRTSLEVVFPQRRAAIVITSPEPGEGKTFVSANLAVAMARAGRSIILVEADLRRPRVRAYFDLPERAPGFADLIEKGAEPDAIAAALIETPYRGLRILPAGSSASEPADLLAGDTLSDVLDGLRSLADFVLLDSPPGLALTDSAILGRVSEGALVITALNRTRGAALRGTMQLLSTNRVNVIGVVVNRSRRATVRSYGRYYHEEPHAGEEATHEAQSDAAVAADSGVNAERLVRADDADPSTTDKARPVVESADEDETGDVAVEQDAVPADERGTESVDEQSAEWTHEQDAETADVQEPDNAR